MLGPGAWIFCSLDLETKLPGEKKPKPFVDFFGWLSMLVFRVYSLVQVFSRHFIQDILPQMALIQVFRTDDS